MARTGRQRLEAIPQAVAAGEMFKERISNAREARDVRQLADLMAEAIAMHREANRHEHIGRDGKAMFSVEEMTASHCMIYAREAYLDVRGSNQPVIQSVAP